MPTASAADVAHLLRRAGFGGTHAEVAALTGMERAALVDHVVDAAAAPVSRPSFLDDRDLSNWEKVDQLLHWWLDRMATSPGPLTEKMTMFWHGHFCTSADKVSDAGMVYDQHQLFRSMALGNFRDLTQAMALQPAMLIYLDNATNTKGDPNENFARELMELFTLGLDEYTQDDVVQAARAWTGYGLDNTWTTYQYWPRRHDNGSKTIFGITRAWDGPQLIDEICLGSKQATMARFIAKKLWSFFAAPSPPAGVVDELAQAFIAGGLAVKPLLRALFNHEQFWAEATRNALVRTPVEFVVATMRSTGMVADDANPHWFMDEMGQRPFYPPNVAGWKQNGYWLSSSMWWARAAFARYVTWRCYDRGLLASTRTLAPADAVQLAFDTFGLDQPSAMLRRSLERFVDATQRTAGQRWSVQPNLTTAVLLAPEFHLA